MAKGPIWTAEERARISTAFTEGRARGQADAAILAELARESARSLKAWRLQASRQGWIQASRRGAAHIVRRQAVPA